MRYYDDLPFKDIGALLDLSENTANQRCVRALLKIKKMLGA